MPVEVVAEVVVVEPVLWDVVLVAVDEVLAPLVVLVLVQEPVVVEVEVEVL